MPTWDSIKMVVNWDDIRLFIDAVISIFAIVNPIGNLPIFLSLTDDISSQTRRRLFHLATIIGLCVVLVMSMFGKFLLGFVFHITIYEFMFGGGLLLMVIGIRSILLSRESHGQSKPGGVEQGQNISQYIHLAVTPIAIPLLVGPGAIVTGMLIINRADNAGSYASGLLAIFAAFGLVWLVLRYSPVIFKAMGEIGTLAVGRIMQIFIVAIGVHFIVRAIKELFPVLAG